MKNIHLLFGAWKIGALLALAVAALVSISGPAVADGSLKVELWDKQDGTQGIKLSTDTVKAGKVTFEIANSSDHLEHEFLIVKTDMTFDQFPMKDAGARVDESKLKGMDEFGDIEEGESKTWNTELTPGRYVLFCNEEGHFGAGMRAVLNVTQ